MSLLTLRRRRPLSGILRVTWRIISSKHCLNSSSLTGQMPLSRAWRSISFWSSISLRRATSILLAGYGLAFCIHYLPINSWKVRRGGVKQIQIDRQLWKSVVALVLPPWIHSLGGMIALRISSALGLLSIGGKAPGRREAVIQNKSQPPNIIHCQRYWQHKSDQRVNAIDQMRFKIGLHRSNKELSVTLIKQSSNSLMRDSLILSKEKYHELTSKCFLEWIIGINSRSRL